MDQKLRTLVEEKRFARELLRIRTNPHDADELVDAVKWTLAREPREGVQVAAKSSIWFIALDQSDENRIGVFYTFNDDQVFLLSVLQEKD